MVHILKSINPVVYILPEDSILREVMNSLDLLGDLKDAHTPFLDIHPMPSGLAMQYKVVNDNLLLCKDILSKPSSIWNYKECIRLMVAWLHYLPKSVLQRYSYESIYSEVVYTLHNDFDVNQDFRGFSRYYNTFMSSFGLKEGKQTVAQEELTEKLTEGSLSFTSFVLTLRPLKIE